MPTRKDLKSARTEVPFGLGTDPSAEKNQSAFCRGDDLPIRHSSDLAPCHSTPALILDNITLCLNLLPHIQWHSVGNLKGGGDGLAHIVHHGVGHNFIKDRGHHTAMDDIFPPLEFSLKRKPAPRFVRNVNNLHTEPYRIMGPASKAVLVVGKSVLQLFARHGSLDGVNPSANPLDDTLFRESKDDIANLFVFKPGVQLQAPHIHSLGVPP